MSKGTARKIDAPNQAGWVVVVLDSVVPGSVAATDPVVVQAAGDLGKATGREYGDQLRGAITHEIGSKRNQTAIGTVQASLTGSQ
jgi:peptidyl-prolyl cis-trans isomerase D